MLLYIAKVPPPVQPTKETNMHASTTRRTPNQPPKADNRAARKRRERRLNSRGLDIIQTRGITAAGSKGTRRRKNGGKK